MVSSTSSASSWRRAAAAPAGPQLVGRGAALVGGAGQRRRPDRRRRHAPHAPRRHRQRDRPRGRRRQRRERLLAVERPRQLERLHRLPERLVELAPAPPAPRAPASRARSRAPRAWRGAAGPRGRRTPRRPRTSRSPIRVVGERLTGPPRRARPARGPIASGMRVSASGGKVREQAPADLERLLDGPERVALPDQLRLEGVREGEQPPLLVPQAGGAHDGRGAAHVASAGVERVELVGHRPVIRPRPAGAHAEPHEPRERRQHVDGRVDAAPVELAREDDLPLGDVAGEVGDGVGQVVVRHGEDRAAASPTRAGRASRPARSKRVARSVYM